MERKIPKKNYIIFFIVILVTVALVFYTNEWIKTYKDNKISVSPLVGTISEINEKELHMSLSETNQVVLYVGYNGNDKVRAFEKKLLKTIKNDELLDFVIYYDVTNNKQYASSLKEEFYEVNANINKAPMFIYIKNGEAIEVIDSNDKMITPNDLENLVSKYDIGK